MRGFISYFKEDIRKIKNILKKAPDLGYAIEIDQLIKKGVNTHHLTYQELDKVTVLLDELYTLINRCGVPPSIDEYIQSMFEQITVTLKGYSGNRTRGKNRRA